METYIVMEVPVGWTRLRLEKLLSVIGGALLPRAGRFSATIVKIPAGLAEGLRKKGFSLEKA